MPKIASLITKLQSSQEAKALLKGSAASFAMKAVGALAALGVSVMLARYLGADAAGVYYMAVSVGFLVVAIARFGMPGFLMRETAAAIACEAGGYRATFRKVTMVLITGASAGAIFLACVSGLIADFYNRDDLGLLLILWTLNIVFVAALTAASQIIRGVQAFFQFSFLAFASVSVFQFVFLGFFALGVADFIGVNSLTAAILSIISANICSAALAIWWAYGALSVVSTKSWIGDSAIGYKRLLKSGSSLMTNELSGSAMRWADTLILAGFVAASDVAIYNSAARIMIFILFLSGAVGIVAGPRLSGAYRSEQWGSVVSTFKGATLLGTALVLPAAMLVCLLSELIMGLFGPTFVAGAPVLQLLIVGAVVSAIVGPYGELLIAAGKEQHVRNAALASVVLGIVLHFMLASRYGALGSAMAASTSVVIRNLWNLVVGWRMVGMAPIWFQLVRPARFGFTGTEASKS